MKVETILNTKGSGVHTVTVGQPLREAIALLAEHNIGAVVVVDEAGQVAGILSERDVLRAAARNEDLSSRPVSSLMTREVVVGSPQDDVAAVMKTMTNRRFRHLPIVEQGKLIGLVSMGDLVKARFEQTRGELATLETQILDE